MNAADSRHFPRPACNWQKYLAKCLTRELRCYARVLEFVTSPEIVLESLQVKVPLVKGH